MASTSNQSNFSEKFDALADPTGVNRPLFYP